MGSRPSTYRRLSIIVDLPATPPADQDIEVRVQGNFRSIKEPTFPCKGNKFGMNLRLGIAVQANPGSGIKERLPQTFKAHLGHLDPAGSGFMIQVIGFQDIFSVDRGHGQFHAGRMVAAIIGIRVFHDRTYVLRQISDGSWNLNSQKIGIAPCLDPRLARENLK